ncbi:MAG: hypothetical protein QXH20_00030 [Candidatus Bathyarchaeia archaeon]
MGNDEIEKEAKEVLKFLMVSMACDSERLGVIRSLKEVNVQLHFRRLNF